MFHQKLVFYISRWTMAIKSAVQNQFFIKPLDCRLYQGISRRINHCKSTIYYLVIPQSGALLLERTRILGEMWCASWFLLADFCSLTSFQRSICYMDVPSLILATISCCQPLWIITSPSPLSQSFCFGCSNMYMQFYREMLDVSGMDAMLKENYYTRNWV